MLSKLKTFSALAAMAGGMVLTSAMAPAPAQAADCPTVSISSLFDPGAVFTCGDKVYYGFDGGDFADTFVGNAIFQKSGTIQTLLLEPTTTPLPGAYSFVFKIDVPNPPYIVSFGSIAVTTGTGTVNPELLLDPPGGPSSTYDAGANLTIFPGATLTSWSLTVNQTPGPLPILGAGAAFGFSRKLRRRIKSVS